MDDLSALWGQALAGDAAPLEAMLGANSRLPGPRADLELAGRLADVAGSTPADGHAGAIRLLTGWLAHPPLVAAELPEPHREYVAACAALAAGALGEVPLLTTAAVDERWRVRELAATGMQRILDRDWEGGLREVRVWLRDRGPLRNRALLARAAAAAVAEPRLLKRPPHGSEACAVVAAATDLLLSLPDSERRDGDVRVLRQALGYAVSVVAAAAPDDGVPLLERLATSADPDARWIARENLKKARLRPLDDLLAVAREASSLTT
ncbi:hypothetical protein LLS1_24910 [Leifsonia sp. LS1]|uniref:hypothetical protein n=1 Tax=Leifsonia sp. LS1 TaxID=2828483 RepID=UPI001CFF11A9|nr:hypothetical protein [Leifsonia sp. LS1]GIT80822.1 hypothetical protein LLS1_24910 [Leifsonia sp. LS1]